MRAGLRPQKRISPQRAASYIRNGHWNDRTLHDGVEAAGFRCPDQVAVIDNRQTLSWVELVRRVAAAVSILVVNRIAPGDPVLVIAGNTADGVIAYHSVLRVGAVAVLLDRRCGAADVRGAMKAVGARTVIAPLSECNRLASEFAGVSLLALEQLAAGDPVIDLAEWPEPDRDEVAVVLFTSGTTGRAKGVTHSINTLTCGARNMALITEADSATVVFLVSPLTSITGVMQMHLAADPPAIMVLEDAFDAEASLDRINRSGATLLGGAPVIVERLVAAADKRSEKRLSLRTLALGGSMLQRPLLERITDEYGIKVARVYGSSEAPNTTGSLPQDSRQRRVADDGALTPGAEVRVGSAEHPQECLVRGPAVFLGYLDDLDNQAAFADDWYRTGDLVEYSEGRITVVGRLREVANRNGFKISLTEIDAALLGAPDIEESACFAVADPTTGERLAVAVLPRSGVETSLEAVVAHLRSAGLATRKLPEQLVIWDEPLPRTASGKIIRSRLVMDAASKRSLLADRLGN